MAALDFPASPSSGQRYIANGSTWEWNGSAWIKLATTSGPTDQVTTTNDTSTAALYPVMVDGAGDNKELKLSTSKLKFDASAGGLTVTGTSGEVTAGVGNTALIVDGDARVLGILTVGSGTVKIDSAGVTATGVATFTNFKTGTTNVHNVGVEAAGINVLGADTPIGTGATVYNSGLIVSKSGGEYQGVVTASTFKGAVEGNVTGNVTGNINATTGTFSGDVSIGGALTYEDVKNVDAIGIITARSAVSIADSIVHTGDTNTAIRFPAADTFSVETAGQQNVQVNGTRVLLKSPSGTDTTVRLQHQGNSGYGDIILDRQVNAFIIDNDPSNASNNASYFSVKNKGTENLRITHAGRVGIASAVPTARLNVQAETSTGICLRLNQEPTDKRAYIQFQDYATTGTDSYILNEGYDLTVYAGYGGKLNLGAYDTTGITVRSTGLVGVGTDNPAYELHVRPPAATSSGQICAESNGTNTFAELVLKTDGGSANIWRNSSQKTDYGGANSLNIYQGASANIAFFTAGNNERLRITSTGKLIISTNTATTAEFDYAGVYFSSSSNSTVAEGLFINNVGAGTGDNASISFSGDSGNRKKSAISHVRNGNYGRGDLTFSIDPDADSGHLDVTAHEKLRITSGGQVRIGNANNLSAWGQNNRLQVAGTDWSGSGITIANMASGNIAPNLVFGKSRGSTPGTAVSNNDRIGYISFVADDGTDMHSVGAAIVAQITGSPSSNSIPASLLFYTGGNQTSNERLRITSTGNLEQNSSGGGLSYFKGSSEYIFGSNTSSPPSGGVEADVQIHAHKTRAQFSINAYMNNSGGPFMQFISSRSGTKGTLGTKCQNNDYLGEIRFMGDNATNYNSLCQGASIYAQAASTPSDGDTTIAGELYFVTGTASGGSSPVRLCIDSAGRLTMNESNVAANAKALRIKADNDTTSTASTDRTGSNSYKNSAIVIQKGISNASLVAGLIDAWDTAIHATSIGISYSSGRYHTSFGVNNDTNDRPVEIMTISGNKKVKIGGGIANIPADIGLEIGGDGATTEIRLKNSGSGTGASDGFAIQKWSNGNNYIYDYDSNNILFGTSNGSRTRMDTSGRWTFSPSGAITSGSTEIAMSIVNNGGTAVSGGAYPGIAFKSTGTGGGNGMSIVNFDGNWDLYTNSGSQQGLGFLHSNSSSSGNARMTIGDDGKVCLGTQVYNYLNTSRYCGTALHVAGGALSIGGNGSSSASYKAGVYTLGWYVTQHANASYYHLKTDLWAGGSPHGNNEYIMGGFRIEGYSYSSPTGSSTAWIQFHNWSGSYPGLSVKQHYHNWDMNPAVYTSSDGYVVLRVNGGTYKGHVIDLIQHTNYGARDINVVSTAYNNNGTHF